MTSPSPILAPSCSLCHASFGGGGGTVELRVGELRVEENRSAVARSGRCVRGGDRINHGPTRTRGSEKIAVRASAGQFKDENVLVNLVDEQPVWRDMAFAVVRPVAGERMVVVGRRKLFSIAQLIDNRLKLLNRKMALQHQLVVALECRCVADGILHFAKSSHILSRFVYVGQFGSRAIRSPSSIAAMVSAFGKGSAEIVNGMRFSRTTVLMYTVITEDAERPMLSQKATKRFLVGASSENVMLAMVFLHSFGLKMSVLYANFTGFVNGRAVLEILWTYPEKCERCVPPAPCRTPCCAVFRRVAGGTLVEKEAA